MASARRRRQGGVVRRDEHDEGTEAATGAALQAGEKHDAGFHREHMRRPGDSVPGAPSRRVRLVEVMPTVTLMVSW